MVEMIVNILAMKFVTPDQVGIYPLPPRITLRREFSVIARNEVTRQSRTARSTLDCFASLAMTKNYSHDAALVPRG